MECGRHFNIEILTRTELLDIQGRPGNFRVSLRRYPRYVDIKRCIACGACADKCPQVVPETTKNLGSRKAIYLEHPQAVPLKYQIDPLSCLKLTENSCGLCEELCPTQAINFEEREEVLEYEVGAVILAPGLKPFDPSRVGLWGWQSPDVLTALEFEYLLAQSTRTNTPLRRPSTGNPVKNIAFLQCVGSRDLNHCDHPYCSTVCCMFAIKEALLARQRNARLEISIFYTDMRAYGKDFERYYQEASEKKGIRFVRSRLHAVEFCPQRKKLRLHYVNIEGRQVEEWYDMVVLAVGLEVPPDIIELAHRLGLRLTANNFAATSAFKPVDTSKPGIFVCGAFSGPKDIAQAVTEGSAAAAAVAEILAPVRPAPQVSQNQLPQTIQGDQKPRIGVFLCHCGNNISSVIDLEALLTYAQGLADVVWAEKHLFLCSQEAQKRLQEVIRDKGLNRVVIGACSPRTHEFLFRRALREAGINQYLLEMANLRHHVAWVHPQFKEETTQKAKDLIAMAVAKVRCQEVLYPLEVPVMKRALVLGGGVAGMECALSLARQGFEVFLVEKSASLGGNARHLSYTWTYENVQYHLLKLRKEVEKNPLIKIFLRAEVVKVAGHIGEFATTISSHGRRKTIRHAVGIIAIGGGMYRPFGEYGYGEYEEVFTSLEFDTVRAAGDFRVKRARNFVFIQCVGSREPGRLYCSKVCCTHSIQTAIDLKKEDPSRRVYILYRDIRTYGEREILYQKARKLGVVFINYDLHGTPKVSKSSRGLCIEVWDHILHRPLEINTDVLVLATAIVPNPKVRELASLYSLAVDSHGFFLEAHSKMRPVDFLTDGLFMAGLSHYPMPLEESVAQAKAAAARAATILAKDTVSLDPVVATVDLARCDGCALCLDVCPYKAISPLEIEEGDSRVKKIQIDKVRCKGCGICQAICPQECIAVANFTLTQLRAQIRAALSGEL